MAGDRSSGSCRRRQRAARRQGDLRKPRKDGLRPFIIASSRLYERELSDRTNRPVSGTGRSICRRGRRQPNITSEKGCYHRVNPRTSQGGSPSHRCIVVADVRFDDLSSRGRAAELFGRGPTVCPAHCPLSSAHTQKPAVRSRPTQPPSDSSQLNHLSPTPSAPPGSMSSVRTHRLSGGSRAW